MTLFCALFGTVFAQEGGEPAVEQENKAPETAQVESQEGNEVSENAEVSAE